MHLIETFEQLVEDEKRLFLGKGSPRALHIAGERLALHKVHHVIDRAVLLEHVVHMHQMGAFQSVETLRLLLEFLTLDGHLPGIDSRADAHGAASARTVADVAKEKLLHGELDVHAGVLHDVGVAEVSRRQVTHHAVLAALEGRSLREQLFDVNIRIKH